MYFCNWRILENIHVFRGSFLTMTFINLPEGLGLYHVSQKQLGLIHLAILKESILNCRYKLKILEADTPIPILIVTPCTITDYKILTKGS